MTPLSSSDNIQKITFEFERYPLLEVQEVTETRSSGKIHLPSIQFDFEMQQQILSFHSCDIFIIQTSVLGKSTD